MDRGNKSGVRIERFSLFSGDIGRHLSSSLQLWGDLKDVDVSASAALVENVKPLENDEASFSAVQPSPTVSGTLACSTCRAKFVDQVEQRHHYKLDWHRHNLKLQLQNKEPLSEQQFEQFADEVSSISGSGSDSSSSSEDEEEVKKTGIHNAGTGPTLNRHPKVFFVNAEAKVYALYRCVLHGKEAIPENSQQFIELVQKSPLCSKWAVIMLGGGHFAAAIFEENDPVRHKTFHSYTVRARQGGSQSSKDSKSGTSHPKSAGASLRRYNEAAFQQHIQDVLDTWSSDLTACHAIFLRAVSHNRKLIFTGKNSPLKKEDVRIRNIPFPTRRATFGEVKRVHGLLSSLELLGSTEEVENLFRPKIGKNSDASGCTGISSELSSPAANAKSGHARKKGIDRAKARLSPSRPLPDQVEALAIASSSDESAPREPYEMVFEYETLDITEDLQPFDDDVPREVKQRRRPHRRKKKTGGQAKEKEEGEFESEKMTPETSTWWAQVLGSRHDCDLFMAALSGREQSGVTAQEAADLLTRSLDTKGNTLLHQAASLGLPKRVRALLEAGADPSIFNKDKNPPFKLCKDWDTKKSFRFFQAEYPEKYNYTKGGVPGGLTEEEARIEEEKSAKQRAANKRARKDRLTEKKRQETAERKEKEREKDEKDRFLALSDREKRALAAERRALASGGQVSCPRCFLCASDMTGKVPFTYSELNFCSMECLKAHRFQKPPTKL